MLKNPPTFLELTWLSEQHLAQNITRFSKNTFSSAPLLATKLEIENGSPWPNLCTGRTLHVPKVRSYFFINSKEK